MAGARPAETERAGCATTTPEYGHRPSKCASFGYSGASSCRRANCICTACVLHADRGTVKARKKRPMAEEGSATSAGYGGRRQLSHFALSPECRRRHAFGAAGDNRERLYRRRALRAAMPIFNARRARDERHAIAGCGKQLFELPDDMCDYSVLGSSRGSGSCPCRRIIRRRASASRDLSDFMACISRNAQGSMQALVKSMPALLLLRRKRLPHHRRACITRRACPAAAAALFPTAL